MRLAFWVKISAFCAMAEEVLEDLSPCVWLPGMWLKLCIFAVSHLTFLILPLLGGLIGFCSGSALLANPMGSIPLHGVVGWLPPRAVLLSLWVKELFWWSPVHVHPCEYLLGAMPGAPAHKDVLHKDIAEDK